MGLDAAFRRIRACGYKATPQRLAILEAIAAEQHQSLEGIRARCPGVGMVTVYRALDLLSGLGLVRRLDLGGDACYELAENHHHHLICEGCGDITEFEQCPVVLKAFAPAGGDSEVPAHSLEVNARCWACR